MRYLRPDWADDSGKWGELTRPKPSALHVQAPQLQPKQSSISLADIAHDAAGTQAADPQPDPNHSRGSRGLGSGSRGEGKDASRSYLSLLESLAQESEFGSPGNSDNDSSPTATQTLQVEQAWEDNQPQGMKSQDPAARYDAEGFSQLSEASSTFGDDAVESLLTHEASDAHMHVNGIPGGMQAPNARAAGDEEAGRQLAEEEDQPSSLALALAALAATAAQKQAEQTRMQQPQPGAADLSKPQTADTDVNEQVSISSDSSCDVLASAAAAAAAAGLSRQREDPPQGDQAAQLWPVPVPVGACAAPVEAQSDDGGSLQDSKAGCSQVTFQTECAQQEGRQQRESASGDYPGPGSSGPSWSEAADGNYLFKEKHAVDYVGKSARRPKVSL